MSRGAGPPDGPRLDPSCLHVFTDFDGTVTRVDTLNFLTERLGGGAAHYEATGRALREGRLTLRDGIARDIGGIRIPFAEAAALLREHVELDPGFPAFARWCAARGIPLTVLSAGFREIIDLFLSPEEFPALSIQANALEPGTWRAVFRDDSPFGHDKAPAVRTARTRGRYAVYVGDGISDEAPATVADEVFARAGGALAQYCAVQEIRCRRFETFDDVRRSLESRLADGAPAVRGVP